jgi:hypothetical protein
MSAIGNDWLGRAYNRVRLSDGHLPKLETKSMTSFPRLAIVALTGACAGCNTHSNNSASFAQSTVSNVDMRELTTAEKKLLSNMLAVSLKDPGSAQFIWAKIPRVQDAEEIYYCAQVNAKNSYGAYIGYQPFMAVIGIAKAKVIGGAMAGVANSDDRWIIENMCKQKGANPYR